MPDASTLWIALAIVFILTFVATVCVLLPAAAGLLPNAPEQYVKPLLKAFLVQSVGALIIFFGAGPPTKPAIETDPHATEVRVIDRQGQPTEFKAFIAGSKDDESTITLSPLERTSLERVPRDLVFEDNQLLIRDDDGFAHGYVQTPMDSLINWLLPLDVATWVGLHLAEYDPPKSHQRRAPRTACRYLTMPFIRPSGTLPDRLLDEAARTLFHIKDECLEEELGLIVVRAMDHRSGPQQHKERGDVLFRYGQEVPKHRSVLFAHATVSYLRFVAGDCGEQCEEVITNIRHVVPEIESLEGVAEIARTLRSKLLKPSASGLLELAADLENAAPKLPTSLNR